MVSTGDKRDCYSWSFPFFVVKMITVILSDLKSCLSLGHIMIMNLTVKSKICISSHYYRSFLEQR